jgi:hypothetical protein
LRCVPDSSLDNDRPPENSIDKAIRKIQRLEVRGQRLVKKNIKFRKAIKEGHYIKAKSKVEGQKSKV